MGIQCVKKNLKDNREIGVYTLVNKNGMLVEVLTLGGIITKILVPDRAGKLENVVLEYKALDTYCENPGYYGAVIGRTGGRIHKGQVHIQDKLYTFKANNNGNTLHGGAIGFNQKIWQAKTYDNNEGLNLALSYTSEDGEEGYPGVVNATVIYTLTEDNSLILTYTGTTTKDTLLNLTNHSYFNLSGNAKRDVLDQKLYVNSDSILELDEKLIPTGQYLDVVENAPFNFKMAKCIGQDIDENHIQLQYGSGYDHAWVLNEGECSAVLSDAETGRCMTVTTNQKAVVIFTQNFPGDAELTSGECAKKRYSICFETQAFPIGHDEVFKEGAILKTGETYHHKTMFKFSLL